MNELPGALRPPVRAAFDRVRRAGQCRILLAGLLAAILIVFIVCSQTIGFAWDEGFHLLAAQLILDGKTPYIDFCFPQPPLNAYWNAMWMRLFGQNWRVTHLSAALWVAGTIFLLASFIGSRLPVERWRTASAIAATCLVGLNSVVVQFGCVAQPYGIGLFLTVAAFRVAVLAPASRSTKISFGTGLLAGAAAGCTLLTTPVAPVLLGWILRCNAAGNRGAKAFAVIAGSLLPFAPVLWLFAKDPSTVLFNVVQYQALYRRVDWGGATQHDIDVLSSWLESSQALLLGFLAVAGVLFVLRSNWDRTHRREFYLAGWIAAALVAYISTAHPTFERYYVFAVPFLGALAAPGIYFVGARLVSPDRPLWPTAVVSLLALLALTKSLFDDRDAMTWKNYEQIARKVDQVAPHGGTLYANELVYFLLRRAPPSGMEFSYSHKLELPPAQWAKFHIVSEAELKTQIAQGRFNTVETCRDELIDKYELPRVFPQQADIDDCSIFWGQVRTHP